LLSLICYLGSDGVAPDTIGEYGRGSFPKMRTALETLSSKSTKSIISPSEIHLTPPQPLLGSRLLCKMEAIWLR
jgi:hypothetical protein